MTPRDRERADLECDRSACHNAEQRIEHRHDHDQRQGRGAIDDP